MLDADTIDVGTLGDGILASVDARGAVTLRPGGTTLRWKVRPGDTWLDPGADVLVRATRPDPAPIAWRTVRVAGGDVIERVSAIGESDGIVVVEVENTTADAIAVSFAIDEPDAVVVSPSRAPAATESDGTLIFPVPHRTSVRVALAGVAVDARRLPDAASVARGWDRVLDRGLRTELPEPLQLEVDAARADLLLAPPSAAAFRTLEAWGFDDAAVAMWPRLTGRERRAVRRITLDGVLGEVHAALVTESGTDLELLPGFRPGWLGHHLAVHDAPTRQGPCSFALRWHGERPALLWDVPAGCTIRIPALDPAFSSDVPQGETLLAAPPAPLLAMGSTARVGEAVDAPEEFS